jgi:hypothetical protein
MPIVLVSALCLVLPFPVLSVLWSCLSLLCFVAAELNVTQYLGHWYQMYGDLFTQGTFELNAVCVAATCEFPSTLPCAFVDSLLSRCVQTA